MSKKYKYVFFDLDGTISNSYEGIARSLDATFAHFGIKVDKALYRRYIGPPLSDTFRLYFDTPEKVSEVVNWFRDNYVEGDIFRNPVYEGIPETMKSLKERGYILCVASCKKQEEAEMLMKHFGIDGYLTYVSGLTYGVREQKAEILEYGMQKVGADRENSVMVGDTIYDIEGAAAVGVDCVLCKWGFADEKALAAKVAFTAERPADLLKFLE